MNRVFPIPFVREWKSKYRKRCATEPQTCSWQWLTFPPSIQAIDHLTGCIIQSLIRWVYHIYSSHPPWRSTSVLGIRFWHPQCTVKVVIHWETGGATICIPSLIKSSRLQHYPTDKEHWLPSPLKTRDAEARLVFGSAFPCKSETRARASANNTAEHALSPAALWPRSTREFLRHSPWFGRDWRVSDSNQLIGGWKE